MWRRRRTALNEALHEVRRPLQALALAGATPPASARIESSVRLAASALERLDREINGVPSVRPVESLDLGPLLRASIERWQAHAASAGSTLVLRGPAAARLHGDRLALAQALDNLVLNAIEHGGPRIVVTATTLGARLRVSVRDCGRPLLAPAGAGREPRGSLRERVLGRDRHGHGLRVVRATASAHRGGFALHRSPGGAEAVLELPRVA